MSVESNPPHALEEGQSAPIYWWAYPSRLALIVQLPIFVVCSLMDESAYALYKHSTKFLTGETVAVGLAAIVFFALGSAFFEPRRASGQVAFVPTQTANTALNVLFAVVLAAYAIFLFPILFSPQLLIDLLQGSTTAMFGMRETLNRIPGVTTFVNLQSLLAVLVVAYPSLTRKPLPKHYFWLVIVLGVACVLRAWLWSERLALIELALPVIIATWAKMAPEQRPRLFRPLTLAPLLGVLVLFVVFAVGEYFRSWQFYQFVYSGSFLEFAGVRFAGYYATALNTGAALCSLQEPFYTPTMTAEWFYRVPFWQFLEEVHRPHSFDPTDFLDAYLNIEFNNTSGVFMPLLDFGPILGVLCWGVLGLISGYLFSAFAKGEVIGLMMFPVWFTGVAEILRVFYWGDSRFFPVIVAGLILTRYLTRPAQEPSHVLSDAPVPPSS